MEAEGIVGLVILVITATMEFFRRKWAKEDFAKESDEKQKQELAARRDAAWRRRDLGGVFDDSKE